MRMRPGPAGAKVGIVGTGAMGRPVVDRLLAAGYQVAAYARRREARESLAASGAAVLTDVATLGSACDVVILYPYNDEQVRQLALDDGLVGTMGDGATVVIHTTANPKTAMEIADVAGSRGVSVIDAPGSGGPAQVAAGELVLFVGGPADAVERCRPLLGCYASQVVHFGDVGSGQRVKLINNLLFGAHTELAVEATRLADDFGIDPALLVQTLHRASGASRALDLVAMMGSADALLVGAGWTIYKDIHYALDVISDLGTSLGSFQGVVDSALERTAQYRRDA